MKKNRMMRLASVLLIMTLLSTSVISGTFAKYTSSVESFDTARVANWGFKPETMNITNLFSQAYDLTANGDKEVQSSNSADVIAPGTWGQASFIFKYDNANADAPEVDYTFVVSTEGSSCAADIQNNTNIKWKLDNGEWGTWEKLLEDIAALDGNKTDNKYDAGTLPEEFNSNQSHTVEWKWAFDDTDDTSFTAENLDTTDTTMGNGSVDALAVTLKITITATQVD